MNKWELAFAKYKADHERAKTLAVVWMLNAIRLQIKAHMLASNKQTQQAEELSENAEGFVVEAFAEIDKLR